LHFHQVKLEMRIETQQLLAEKKINGSVLLAAGCGAIPISYIDVGSTMAVQLRMIKDLCDIYEVEWDEHVVKGLVASAVGNIGKRMGASMLKSIPIVGTVIGGFANATLSGVSTYAMGHAFVKYMNVNSTVKSVKDIDMGVLSGMSANIVKQTADIARTIREKLLTRTPKSASNDTPIIEQGEKVFGSKEKFNAWLNTKNPILGGAKPLELLLSADDKDHERIKRLIALSQQEQTI